MVLMTRDARTPDAFGVTQEFLAFMLGVRVVSVSPTPPASCKRANCSFTRQYDDPQSQAPRSDRMHMLSIRPRHLSERNGCGVKDFRQWAAIHGHSPEIAPAFPVYRPSVWPFAEICSCNFGIPAIHGHKKAPNRVDWIGAFAFCYPMVVLTNVPVLTTRRSRAAMLQRRGP